MLGLERFKITEKVWWEGSNPGPMLDFVLHSCYGRALHLFSVACCRRIYHLLTDERSRAAVEKAEWYAERCTTEEECFDQAAFRAAKKELDEAAARAAEVLQSSSNRAAYYAAYATYYAAAIDYFLEVDPPFLTSLNAAYAVAYSTVANRNSAEWEAAVSAEQAQQCKILHELVGPLLVRPKGFNEKWWNPGWLTRDVIAVAQMIYQQNRLEDMPILGDALEEAGCINAKFLDHCRQPTGHLRGCWVLAWILQLLD